MNYDSSHPLVTDKSAEQDNRLDPWQPPFDLHPGDWESTWTRRDWHNWRQFMRPLADRLTAAEYTFCRRVIRPKRISFGVIKRREASCGTPADYASHRILEQLCDRYDPLMPPRRRIVPNRTTADIDEHATAIASAMQDLIESRPSTLPHDVSDRSELAYDAVPVTRKQIAPVKNGKVPDSL